MNKLKFAVIGCGFWADFQISAWRELEGVELIAVCDSDLDKAQKVAEKFNVKNVYQSADELFDKEKLDFVDIISGVNAHLVLIKKAASRGIPVICQKPMALDLETAKELVGYCKDQGVPFFVHENFRWQSPIRKVKDLIDNGVVGEIFKTKISFCTGFPVFENQPYLAEVNKLIIADLGIHLLDVSRFLLGEMRSISCQTKTVNKNIKGEDVANIFMETEDDTTCFIEMSFASVIKHDYFPQTFIMIEGDKGSIYLGPDFNITVTTRDGTTSEHVEVNSYDWVDPDYAVAHASIVDANRNILQALMGTNTCETTGDDNLKTLKLVYAAYEAAEEASVVSL